MNIKYHESFKPFIKFVVDLVKDLLFLSICIIALSLFFLIWMVGFLIVTPLFILLYLPSFGWSIEVFKFYKDILNKIWKPAEDTTDHFDSWRNE